MEIFTSTETIALCFKVFNFDNSCNIIAQISIVENQLFFMGTVVNRSLPSLHGIK